MSMTKSPKSRAQHLHKIRNQVLKMILGNTFLTGWPVSVKFALKKRQHVTNNRPLSDSYFYAHIELYLPSKYCCMMLTRWKLCLLSAENSAGQLVFKSFQILLTTFKKHRFRWWPNVPGTKITFWLSAVVVKALFVKPRDIAWLWIDQPMQSIPHSDPGTKCQKLLLDPFDYIPSCSCTNLGWI